MQRHLLAFAGRHAPLRGSPLKTRQEKERCLLAWSALTGYISNMKRKLAHLEMVQAIVTRMARNSFQIKGWSVTLVTALFALAAMDDINENFVYVSYFPAIMFWILDAYFLRQERLFRKLYDNVRTRDESQINFSMSTSAFQQEVDGVWKVAWSFTLRVFHLMLIGAIIVVMAIMIWF